jgi:hypothetical protein
MGQVKIMFSVLPLGMSCVVRFQTNQTIGKAAQRQLEKIKGLLQKKVL